MVRFRRNRTVNTYGKKRENKAAITNVHVINVTNHYNVVNNYYNIINSPSKEEQLKKQEKENAIHNFTKHYTSSTSTSGDEFDKLLKGPTYNAPCSSNSHSSPRDRKYIWERQETISSYYSDATPVSSDFSSIHLFKDFSSNLSSLYSPSNIPPLPVKGKRSKRIVTTFFKKQGRVCKKKINRNISTLGSTKGTLKKENAMSSTPTHPDSKRWVELHVSPILPLTATSSAKDQVLEGSESCDIKKKPQPCLGISALAEQFNELWRIPVNDKHSDSDHSCDDTKTNTSCFPPITRTSNKTDNSTPKSTKDCPEELSIDSSNEIVDNDKMVDCKECFKVPCINSKSDFERQKELSYSDKKINSVCEDTSCVVNKVENKSVCSLTCSVNQLEHNSSGNDIDKDYNPLIAISQRNDSVDNLLQENLTPDCDTGQKLLNVNHNKSCHILDLNDTNKPIVYNILTNNLLSTNKKGYQEDFHISFDRENLEIKESSPSLKPVETSRREENNTLFQCRMSLTPGKRWRRSFLKRKKTELKRSTIGPSLIARLIKDGSCSQVIENSSRYFQDISSRSLNMLNTLNKNSINKSNSTLSSQMSSTYLIPNCSPEITQRISIRTKGKDRYQYYCDNGYNMEQILEESVSPIDEQHYFNDSMNDSIELNCSEQLPGGNKSDVCKSTEDKYITSQVSNTSNVTPTSSKYCIFQGYGSHTENQLSNMDIKYNINSYNNSGASNKEEYSLYPITDDSKMCTSYTEMCPLIKSAGLLNTITKRKKPQPKRYNEEDSFVKEFEYLSYDYFDGEDCQAHGTPADVVLLRCRQDHPLLFSEVFPEKILAKSKKIGEGVYGEVFTLCNSDKEKSVLKIIPVEGDRLVNNQRQKKFEEVLSELIITQELSALRENDVFRTSGFCLLKNTYCLNGEYPLVLIKSWEKFAKEKESLNDCPDIFDEHQLYITLELEHAGEPLESFKFSSAKQAYAIFLQCAFSLAIAEIILEFEHRDLHIGNVLLSKTTEEYVEVIHNGDLLKLPSFGIKATIIDFTLSRITYKGDVMYFDLASDPELFDAEGDYQFEVYRLMKNDVNNQWNIHAPVTNIRWLHYLADKLVEIKYSCKKSKLHTQYLKKMKDFKRMVEDFSSSSEFVNSLLKTELHARSIIKKTYK